MEHARDRITEKDFDDCVNNKYNGDYSLAFKRLNLRPEDIIPTGSDESEAIFTEVPATQPNINDNRELIALSKVINALSDANEYGGMANMIESGKPKAIKLFGPNNYEKMEEYRDKSISSRKYGIKMLDLSIGNGLLEKYGYFKPKEADEFDSIVERFDSEYMGPAKPNVARRRKVARQMKKLSENNQLKAN